MRMSTDVGGADSAKKAMPVSFYLLFQLINAVIHEIIYSMYGSLVVLFEAH